MANPKHYHVVSYEGKWAVKQAGYDKPLVIKGTKQEAFEAGRFIAKQAKGELFIHRLDGTIENRESYGNDPYPPRG